jgi:RNA polymerase sigma factor (sigma-70 family)
VTDEVLMRAVREGDISKLGLLFERHHVPLFDFLCRTTGDRAVAEDLVQEVFMRILRYRRTYRDDGRFETWMFHIARNVRLDHFRRARHLEERLADDGPEVRADDPGADQQLEASERVAQLRRALMQLPDDKRELLVLARYRGMKYDQLAAMLRVDAGTVRVRVHRAIRELRALVRRLSGEEQSCDVKKPGTSLRIV